MLINNMKHVVPRKVLSFCKKCSTLHQLNIRKFTASSRYLAAPTVEQTLSRLKTGVGQSQIRTGATAVNNSDQDDDHLISSNKDHPLSLSMQRVIESAENILDYRLHNISNLLLWIRPQIGENEGIPTPIHENEAKVIFASVGKLKGSEHPLLNYVKRFQNYDDRPQTDTRLFSTALQLRSMIVLLISNAFGISNKVDNKTSVILQKQKSLAEIAELMYTAHMIHRTVIEIPKEYFPVLGKVKSDSSSEPIGHGASMHQGNKVATLMGDIILARSSKALSSLKAPRVTELMSISIEDFAESEAIVNPSRVLTLSQNTKDPGWNSNSEVQSSNLSGILTYDKWLKRTSLSVGSLLRNACYGCLIFGGHGEDEITQMGGIAGHNVALVLQAHKDSLIFDNVGEIPRQIELCSLPFIFHLEKNPKLLSNCSDIETVYNEVRSCPYARARTKESLQVLTNDAIRHLSTFTIPNSYSKVLTEFLTLLSS